MWQVSYFFKEAFLSLRENSAATVITAVTVALTMMLFGSFLLVYLNLSAMVGSLRQEIRIILYLRDGISEQEVASLHERLRQQAGVAKASYISREQALEDFRQSLKEKDLLLKGLGENPLPASFELTLKKASQSSEAVRRLAEQVSRLPGVDDIQYGREWVENVNAVLGILKRGSTIGGLVLGLVAVVITSSTIGLAVWARLSDIEVLKLIGATRTYIRMPFLIEGGLIGLMGSALSLLLLRMIYGWVKNRLAETGGFLGSGLTPIFLPTPWPVLFLVIGVGLGWMGSLLSTRRL